MASSEVWGPATAQRHRKGGAKTIPKRNVFALLSPPQLYPPTRTHASSQGTGASQSVPLQKGQFSQHVDRPGKVA